MTHRFYTTQSRALQDRFDSKRLADRLFSARWHDKLSADDAVFISSQSFFFIATADDLGRPDCSFKGGIPGFVVPISDTTLEFPSYDGNGMYRTLGNIAANHSVGLLFIDFGGAKRRLRVNGSAKLIEPQEAVGLHHAAELVVSVTIRDIFPNCPRYIPDPEGGVSEYTPRPGYSPPDPLWKSKPDLCDVLPRRPVVGGQLSKDN